MTPVLVVVVASTASDDVSAHLPDRGVDHIGDCLLSEPASHDRTGGCKSEGYSASGPEKYFHLPDLTGQSLPILRWDSVQVSMNEALRNGPRTSSLLWIGYSPRLTTAAVSGRLTEPSRRRRGAQPQSARRTLMRSMEAARRAGSNEASQASSSTKTAASVSTSGSKGLTPNRKEPSSREATATPNSPIAHPRIATLVADAKTRRRMPARCEPKAMRMAISCARSAAEKAITLYMPSAASNAAAMAKAEMTTVLKRRGASLLETARSMLWT